MPLIQCPACGQNSFVPTSAAGSPPNCAYCHRPLPGSKPAPPASGEVVFLPVDDDPPPRPRSEMVQSQPLGRPPAQPVNRGPTRRIDESDYGAPRRPPQPPSPSQRPGSGPVVGLGIASAVAGLALFLLCVIRLPNNLLIVPAAAVGLALGGAGLFVCLARKSGGIAFPIAGLATNVVATVAVTCWLILKPAAPTVDHAFPDAATARAAAEEARMTSLFDEWSDAFEGVTRDNRRVQVLRAWVAQVNGINLAGRFTTDEKHLLLSVRIANTSPTLKFDYRGWGVVTPGSNAPAAEMWDDVGNGYRRGTFSLSAEVDGQISTRTVYPEKFVDDILVFEKPVSNCRWIRLELPGANVGINGVLKLQLKASAVERDDVPPPPKPTPPPPKPVPPPPTPAETVARQREDLKSPDAAKRQAAVAGLRAAGPAAAEAVPDLIAALNDADAGVRAAAAETLADLGRSAGKAYADLVRSTGDADARVRQAAERYLQAFGDPPPEAVSPLVALAGDAKLATKVRQQALAALSRFRPDPRAVVPMYLSLLKAPDDGLREQAAKCLGALGKTSLPTVLPGLLAALNDANPAVREAASAAIDRTGPVERADVPALTDALKNGATPVRLRALRCLVGMGKNGRDAAIDVLAVLKDREPALRVAAGECVLTIAPDRYAETAELLMDRDKEVRKAAAANLGRLVEPARAFEVFADALAAPDEASRKDAAEALDRVQLPAVNDVPTRTKVRLAAALKDTHPTVRMKVARALYRLDWDVNRLAGVLAKLLSEPADGVGKEAADLLHKIGPAATHEAAPELLRAIQSRDAPTRRASAGALRTAGPFKDESRGRLIAALADDALHDDLAPVIAEMGPGGVADLITALDNRSPEIRAGAARALGLIGPNAMDAYKPLVQRYNKDPDPRVKREADTAMTLIRKK